MFEIKEKNGPETKIEKKIEKFIHGNNTFRLQISLNSATMHAKNVATKLYDSVGEMLLDNL